MQPVDITIHKTFLDFSPKEWNDLSPDDFPFTDYEFLAGLEESACVGRNTSWQPFIVSARKQSELVGIIPAFLRMDSYGEFIFDWQWAEAWHRSGLPYYPKITVAIPFTPANGPRILVKGQNIDITRALLEGLRNLAQECKVSGMHFLCLTRAEQKILSGNGFLARITHQYHWHNYGYQKFQDYLADMRSHRRKEINRERKKVAEQGIRIVCLAGNDITTTHLESMYNFYLHTYARKWGSPYLNQEFFSYLYHNLRHRLVMSLAYQENKLIAGTLNFRKGNHLYGRYWGADSYYPCLHFELCFYSLIEYCIREKITLFEAGAQGEHKFQRGFGARPVYSSHFFFNESGHAAVSAQLKRDNITMLRALQKYRDFSPLHSEAEYIPEITEE